MLLPWLILEDNEFRSRILAHHPEIAMEGGDPAQLPLPIREKILSDVVERLVRHEDCGAASDNSALARIARPDLTGHTLGLVDRYPDNDEALFFLGRLVWQGAMSGSVSRLSGVAADPARGAYARIAATRAVTTCGTEEQRRALPEGGNTSSIPYSLVFAMAGLAIEADEVDGFPRHLAASEVRLALRYIVFELNGFPRWLESMYRVWPKEVLDAVLTELFWELENTEPNGPMHYILHDLAIYAPWLHGALAGPLPLLDSEP